VIPQTTADAAARTYWDRAADEYQAEHGSFLAGGTHASFVWGPEGATEADLRLLGPAAALPGAHVLEVGCGAAQCSTWLRSQKAHALGLDLSAAQLGHAAPSTPVVAGSAVALPFRADSFDLAFSAYGAVQFVADLDQLLAEVHRVLRPGARFVFSVTHPIRWAFPDDPGQPGLTVSSSYFDRAAYVERATPGGHITYAEFHRTLSDYSTALRRSGFGIDHIVEPEWPAWNDAQWGGWSPARGRVLPGTLILGCRADADR
jgi:SAM-dependent methyltransferase